MWGELQEGGTSIADIDIYSCPDLLRSSPPLSGSPLPPSFLSTARSPPKFLPAAHPASGIPPVPWTRPPDAALARCECSRTRGCERRSPLPTRISCGSPKGARGPGAFLPFPSRYASPAPTPTTLFLTCTDHPRPTHTVFFSLCFPGCLSAYTGHPLVCSSPHAGPAQGPLQGYVP